MAGAPWSAPNAGGVPLRRSRSESAYGCGIGSPPSCSRRTTATITAALLPRAAHRRRRHGRGAEPWLEGCRDSMGAPLGARPTGRRQAQRMNRGAATLDVRASVPPSPPLVSDPDTTRCIQIEPVRPATRNGRTTLQERRDSRPGGSGGDPARHRSPSTLARQGNQDPMTELGLVKSQLRGPPMTLPTRCVTDTCRRCPRPSILGSQLVPC